MDNVPEMLDRLARLRSKVYDHQEAHDALVERIMKPVAGKLAEARKRFEALTTPICDKIDALEKQIKTAVQQAGETVRGEELMAVYFKPRVTWNQQMLEGFRREHPFLDVARNEAEAGTIMIRPVGGNNK